MSNHHYFKPTARLLLLLGDELIPDAGYAVFELVKNAYDADATIATVEMINPDQKETGKIQVCDDGHGMPLDVVKNVWLEPGTSYRQHQVSSNYTTPRFGRTPLGAKGVGRFASHKLGFHVTMVTRTKGHPEVVVNVDWTLFEEKQKYLEEIPIEIFERNPQVFLGEQTGTHIYITSLRESWKKGQARELFRHINSICSPFEDDSSAFEVAIDITGPEGWLEKLTTPQTIKRMAPFRATCTLSGDKLYYCYELTYLHEINGKIDPRTKIADFTLPLQDKQKEKDEVESSKDEFSTNEISLLSSLGDITIQLFIFDLDSKVLGLTVTHDKSGVKKYLRERGGIKVYRDGMRVFGLGDANDDWLNLGGRRVNAPGTTLSNNQVLGAVSLNLKDSHEYLIEKTNRDGFVTNAYFNVLKKAVLFILTQIEAERNYDKERIKAIVSKAKPEPVLGELDELRSVIKTKHPETEKDIFPYLKRVEREYNHIKDVMFTAASSGMGLSIALHEAEKRIFELKRALHSDQSQKEDILKLAEGLAKLVEGYGSILKGSAKKKTCLKDIVEDALFNISYRINYHNVDLAIGYSQDISLAASVTPRLIISTIINILDNSLFWLRHRGHSDQKIYIDIVDDFAHGPAIVIADNGTGFTDPPDFLTKAFITRKTDGMGLGLYLADKIMETHDGVLSFIEPADTSIPEEYTGACIALIFKGEK